MKRFCIFCFVLLFIEMNFSQSNIPSVKMHDRFLKMIQDSIVPVLDRNCTLYHCPDQCVEPLKLKLKVIYKLIPKNNILDYDTTKNLFDFVQIDSICPAGSYVYKKSKYLGFFGFGYDKSSFFNGIAEFNDDKTGIASMKKQEVNYQRMLHKNPEYIFSLRCGIITVGYVINNKMYLLDFKTDSFMESTEYIIRYNYLAKMRSYFKTINKLKMKPPKELIVL
jgi:hypothetical protein